MGVRCWSLQRYSLAAVSAVAIAAGVLAAFSATGSLGTETISAVSRSTPMQLERTNRISEDLAADSDRQPALGPAESPERSKRRFYRIEISTPALASKDIVVEIPKTTARSSRIWASRTFSEAGAFSELEAVNAEQGLNGLVVTIPKGTAAEATIYLETLQYSAGRPQITAWDAATYQDSLVRLERKRSLYLTLFLSLAFFGAAVAVMSRDFSFLIFAGWLVTSLRVLAVNSGWGYPWLEDWLTPTLISPFLTSTLALHAFLTISLFGQLHASTRNEGRSSRALRYFGFGYLSISVLAFVLPKSIAHPTLWALAALGILVLIGQLTRKAVMQGGTTTWLYLAAWIFMLGGFLGEIGAVSQLLPSELLALNAETGTLTCGAIMALALSHRLQEEAVSRQRAQNEAAQASRKLSENYAAMPIGLFSLDGQGQLQLFNPAFSNLFVEVQGIAPVAGKTMVSELAGAQNWDAIASRTSQGSSTVVPVASGSRSDAQPYYLEFRIKAEESRYEGSVENVTRRVSAERTLAHLVDHDSITGALNQRGHNEAVANALKRAGDGVNSSVVAIEIDRFNVLNELHGFQFGDKLLATYCGLIRTYLGVKDSVARIGNVFRLVLVDRSTEEAIDLVTRLQRRSASEPLEVDNRLVSISTSIGIVALDPELDARDAIAASSQACAEARMKGTNRTIQFGHQDRALQGYLEELRVQVNLQDRIDSQRFYLEMQPIVSFRSAFEEFNYEVLVRMRDEDGSVISPGRFIPAAERNGQMSLIDRWVVMSTLTWLDQNMDHVRHLGYATINLSGSSLNDARFVDNLFAMISDFPAISNKLCFEITETVALADQSSTKRFAERVHSLGSRVALDDFGAGYTSFTYLREIDADVIKIDGSFVKDIHENRANHAITRMIVELTHQLGKRCVAEWAEKPEVIAALMSMGVDYGQGFGLARPMAPALVKAARCSGDLVADPQIRAMLRGETRRPGLGEQGAVRRLVSIPH